MHFMPLVSFYNPKSLWFSDAFRGCKKGPAAWNGFIRTFAFIFFYCMKRCNAILICNTFHYHSLIIKRKRKSGDFSLTLPVPNPEKENFYFRSSLWFLKRFYEGLERPLKFHNNQNQYLMKCDLAENQYLLNICFNLGMHAIVICLTATFKMYSISCCCFFCFDHNNRYCVIIIIFSKNCFGKYNLVSN